MDKERYRRKREIEKEGNNQQSWAFTCCSIDSLLCNVITDVSLYATFVLRLIEAKLSTQDPQTLKLGCSCIFGDKCAWGGEWVCEDNETYHHDSGLLPRSCPWGTLKVSNLRLGSP
jgi:hypothetical protein